MGQAGVIGIWLTTVAGGQAAMQRHAEVGQAGQTAEF